MSYKDQSDTDEYESPAPTQSDRPQIIPELYKTLEKVSPSSPITGRVSLDEEALHLDSAFKSALKVSTMTYTNTKPAHNTIEIPCLLFEPTQLPTFQHIYLWTKHLLRSSNQSSSPLSVNETKNQPLATKESPTK